MQLRQRLGNFWEGGGMTQRGGILGTEVTQWGPGQRSNRGLVDRPPKLILILEMDVKLELVLSTVTNPMGSL